MCNLIMCCLKDPKNVVEELWIQLKGNSEEVYQDFMQIKYSTTVEVFDSKQ